MNKKTNKSISYIFSRVIILLTLSIIIIISVAFSVEYDRSIKTNAIISTKEIITQVDRHLGDYISDIMEVGTYTKNLIYQRPLYSDEEINNKLKTIVNTRKDFVAIILFDSLGNPVFSTDDTKIRPNSEIVSQNWFKQAEKGGSDFYFSSPHIQKLGMLRYPWVISYSQKTTYKTLDGKKAEGIMLIDINFNAVSEIINNVTLGKTGYVYLIDNDSNIVYHPMQNLINLGQFNEDISSAKEQIFGVFNYEYEGRNRLSVIHTVDNCRWRLVGIAFMDELTRDGRYRYMQVIILILFLTISFTVMMAKSITRKVTSPIKELQKQMEDIELNMYKPPQITQGSLEVISLSDSFIQMTNRIRSLMDAIVKEQEEKRKSELDALQAKINPHFLYNTLDSVVWLAEQNDTEGVIKLVTALAKLFRISISKGHEIITLQEEFEHAKNYLIIQQMRYEDKFEFKTKIEDGLENCPTIKLIIQPIVENSIYHGIKYLMDPGLITIEAKKVDNNKISICISDNGIGMDEEKVKSLLCAEESQHIKDGNGIGVINVHKRIKLAYGEEYGLNVESELDEGTKICITLPLMEEIIPIKVAKE